MKMTSLKMKRELEKYFDANEYSFSFDKKQDELRIVNKECNKGITIVLGSVIAKWEVGGEKALEEVVYYIQNGLRALATDNLVTAKDKKIYPVIRSTSFPKETSDGKAFVTTEHTAETRIYYALDLGNTYRLIDESLMNKEGLSKEVIMEQAKFSMRTLPTPLKKDTLVGNDFYFLNTNDGYDASRILNIPFLNKMKEEVKGSMVVAVPHQDVLIIADIQTEVGFDILAELTMSFFTSGKVPITSLSFLYENEELEPIFVMGKNQRKYEKDSL